jgi:hypothetical protein
MYLPSVFPNATSQMFISDVEEEEKYTDSFSQLRPVHVLIDTIKAQNPKTFPE